MYDVDVEAGTVRYHARDGDPRSSCPWTRCTAPSGWRPAAVEFRSAIVPDAHGGNMDSPEMRDGVRRTSG